MMKWTKLSDDEHEEGFWESERNDNLHGYINDHLKQGCNPNSYWEDASSLLTYICLSQDIKAAKKLLENGADPNGDCPGSSGEAPIVVGLRRGERNREMVELLLSYNADVNCDEGRLGSPLDVVLWGGDEECLRILLEAGADPKYGGVDGDRLPNIRVPDTVSEEQQKRIVELFAEFGHELPEIRK